MHNGFHLVRHLSLYRELLFYRCWLLKILYFLRYLPYNRVRKLPGRGGASYHIRWFATSGSWWTSHESFKFRLEAGKLRLIGVEESSFARNQGEMTLTSTNHLTGKRKITNGISAFDDQPYRPKISWEDLESRKPIYLEDLPPCGRKD